MVMPNRFDLMIGFGMVLFAVGAATRAHMNTAIRRSPLLQDPGTRSTEVRYWRLIKEQGATVWPLVVTVVFIPLGVLVAFAAIIFANWVGGG